MKKFLVKLPVMLFVLSAIFFIESTYVSAATEKCYTIKDGNTTVYSNTGLTKKYGSIYDTDEIIILDIKEKYSKVEYPVSNGNFKTGYIHTSAILTSITGTSYQARNAVTTYQRPDGHKYGNIDKNDIVLVYGKAGNYTQVRYPVSGGYKYAFIKTKDAQKYILNEGEDTDTPKISKNIAAVISDGIYKVVSGLDSHYVWDIDDASNTNGANLQIYKDNGTNAQKFRFTKQSDGYYKITNVKSKKVVNCYKAGKNNGTNLQQYSDNNTSAQRWKLIEAGNGYCYIQCKCNGLYVDVKDGKAKNKSNIQMYRENQTASQKFKLISVENTEKESSDWVWPTSNHKIGNDYPYYSNGKYHGGMDFAVKKNTLVYASCDGTVASVKSLKNSYGKHIKIKAVVNGATVYIRYCHLNKYIVKKGEKVNAQCH